MSFPGFPGFPVFPAAGFFGVPPALLGALGGGLIKPRRSINDLTPDVVVEERHGDRLTITQQPVEKTAAITDHAYKEPPLVNIRCGWSCSSPQAAGDLSYPQAIYDQLLEWQDSVELLTVYTGKRRYTDMLLAEIEVVTDKDSEFALLAALTFQHVILVESTTVQVPPNNVQKQPQSTGTTVKKGPVNAKPVPTVPQSLSTNPGATTLFNVKPIKPINQL